MIHGHVHLEENIILDGVIVGEILGLEIPSKGSIAKLLGMDRYHARIPHLIMQNFSMVVSFVFRVLHKSSIR